MKVLQINSVCGIRSTGRICTDLAETLEAQGHDCKIAYGREFVPEGYQKYAVRIGSDFDVKYHALHSRIFDDAGFRSQRATGKFIDWVQKWDPDIIHLHNIHGYYINIKMLFDYLLVANKPVIWTMHDCWAITGHCAYFTMAKCAKWERGCYECPQTKSYPASFIMDRSKQNYLRKRELFTHVKNMTIVTPSKWLAEIIKESFLNKYPVRLINNGVDLSVFKPISSDFREIYGLENKKILLGVASVWDERKGLNDFVSLADLLDDEYQIVLVGLNKKQIQTLPPNIIGITRTNNVVELAQIYTAADVFVNPTLEDNSPVVNLEALACGTPVITYDTGGSPECLDENSGVVAKEKTPQSLVDAIQGNLYRYSRESCISRAAKFESNGKYSEYIELFEEMNL